MKRVQRERVEQEEEGRTDGRTNGRLCELLFILITHVPLPRVLISLAVRQSGSGRITEKSTRPEQPLQNKGP